MFEPVDVGDIDEPHRRVIAMPRLRRAQRQRSMVADQDRRQPRAVGVEQIDALLQRDIDVDLLRIGGGGVGSAGVPVRPDFAVDAAGREKQLRQHRQRQRPGREVAAGMAALQRLAERGQAVELRRRQLYRWKVVAFNAAGRRHRILPFRQPLP
jgi:hypothetical protein